MSLVLGFNLLADGVRELSLTDRVAHDRAAPLRPEPQGRIFLLDRQRRRRPRYVLEIAQGESFGIVGESGYGKSTLIWPSWAISGPSGAATAGRVVFEGRDILKASPAELRRLRGSGVSMVYQDPNAALNPTLKIGRQSPRS